jgi:hypothetical protein
MDAQRRLVGIDPLRLPVPTAGPESPQDIVAGHPNGEPSQPIKAPVLANPSAGADVINMARRTIASLDGLPIGEVPLLRFGYPIESLLIVRHTFTCI